MNLIDNKPYLDSVHNASMSVVNWSKLQQSTILIVGASSMVGRFFVDVLLHKKKHCREFSQMKILCAGRDSSKLKSLFNDNQNLNFVQMDVSDSESVDEALSQFSRIDYLINLSSPVGGKCISSNPVGIFYCNVIGSLNLLNICRKTKAIYVFASSIDVYGDGGQQVVFDESQNGIVDTMNNRACYFESKRMAETLCNCFNVQYGVDFYIFRFPKIFGPTMNEQSQNLILNMVFKQCIEGKDPIMKSSGEKTFSFLYAYDAVVGMFTGILNGNPNQVYNVSDSKCDGRIIDIVNSICNRFNKKAIIEDQNYGFFETCNNKTMNSTKLHNLGWNSKYSLETAIDNMVDIMTY